MSIRSEEQEYSYELHVVRDAFNEKHGSFVSHVLTAFSNTDPENFEMMRPFMHQVIKKYNLGCNTACLAPWKGPIPEWATRETSDSRTGRLSMPEDGGLVWIGDSLLDSFLAPYKDREVTIEVRELF